jgi:hypothetical protein
MILEPFSQKRNKRNLMILEPFSQKKKQEKFNDS